MLAGARVASNKKIGLLPFLRALAVAVACTGTDKEQLKAALEPLYAKHATRNAQVGSKILDKRVLKDLKAQAAKLGYTLGGIALSSLQVYRAKAGIAKFKIAKKAATPAISAPVVLDVTMSMEMVVDIPAGYKALRLESTKQEGTKLHIRLLVSRG